MYAPTYQPEKEPEKVSRWQQWRKAILRSFALIGLSIAAIVANQRDVDPPPLPIVACGASQWQFTNDYRAVISGEVTVISNRFKCDLASIPHLAADALGIQRDHPAIRRGAAVHDWRYRYHIGTREHADWLLWQACIEDGMDEKKALAVYRWVQTWGFEAWDRSSR